MHTPRSAGPKTLQAGTAAQTELSQGCERVKYLHIDILTSRLFGFVFLYASSHLCCCFCAKYSLYHYNAVHLQHTYKGLDKWKHNYGMIGLDGE